MPPEGGTPYNRSPGERRVGGRRKTLSYATCHVLFSLHTHQPLAHHGPVLPPTGPAVKKRIQRTRALRFRIAPGGNRPSPEGGKQRKTTFPPTFCKTLQLSFCIFHTPQGFLAGGRVNDPQHELFHNLGDQSFPNEPK